MLNHDDVLLIQSLLKENNKQLRLDIQRDIQIEITRAIEPLATKNQLFTLSHDLTQRITSVEQSLTTRITSVEQSLTARIASVEQSIVILELKQKKQFRNLGTKLNFITKFFDKEIVDLRKQVDHIRTH